jgi:hypothetical protein
MLKYRSKCRWNLLLCIDDKIVEICPNQEFLSSHEVDSKYLELISEPKQEIIIEKKPTQKKVKEFINESINNFET